MALSESTQLLAATTWITIGAALVVSGAAFVVMRLYVRNVFRESQRSVSLEDNGRAGDQRTQLQATPSGPLEVEVERLNGPPGPLVPRSPTFRHAEGAFRRAACVYALGGTVHVTTTVWLLFQFGVYSLPSSTSRLASAIWHVSVFWSWSIFTMVALALFWGPDRRFRALLVLGYLAALPAMGGLLQLAGTPVLPLLEVGPLLPERRLVLALVETVTGTPVEPAAVTFSPFSQPMMFWALGAAPVLLPAFTFNRFVRGTVGPLFINLALAITVLTFVFLDLCVGTSPGLRLIGYLRPVFGGSTLAILVIVSVMASATVAWLGLLWIGHRYRRFQLSDQTFLFDALWLAVSLWICVYLMGDGERFRYLLGFLPFVCYKAVVGYGLVRLRKREGRRQAARLLYLRVFGSSHRTEKLFDLLAARWRYAGSIQLISATDVARGRFEPDEFLNFLNGRLGDAFVSSDADLRRRLEGLDVRPDPDGRYRVNEFFCHADTWKKTVRRLMAESDLLIMDLREFASERKGAIFELGAILDDVPLAHVVMLIDDTTNEPQLRTTLADLWKGVRPQSPNVGGSARVRIIHFARGYGAVVHRLMQLGDERMAAA